MTWIPDDGKIVIAAPPVAEKIAGMAPTKASRVFTWVGLPEDMVYVLDVDALNDALDVTHDSLNVNEGWDG